MAYWKQRVLAVGLILSVILIAACGGAADDGMEVAVDGPRLLEERCTGCHGIEEATSLNQTEAEWEATVENMIQRGAELNEEEKAILVEYLAQEYGPE